MIYMFLSNNPSSGDINSSNLSCFTVMSKMLLLRGIAPTAKELTYVILWLIECGFRKL